MPSSFYQDSSFIGTVCLVCGYVLCAVLFLCPELLDRIFSQEIPSDVTIHAGGTSFSLHKVGLELLFACGYDLITCFVQFLINSCLPVSCIVL